MDLFLGKAEEEQAKTNSGTVAKTVAANPGIATQQNAASTTNAVAQAMAAVAGSAATSGASADNNTKDAAAGPADMPLAFTPQGVEDHMNQWLVSVLRQQNDFQMQTYNQAMEGWKNTNARNRELGLPEVPPPPAPQLAEAAPMPPGWWLQAHS
jgi:hypothetical protein